MVRILPRLLLVVTAASFSFTAQAADPAKGKTLFQAQCALCHGVTATARGIGPTLFGVVGRKAGTMPGFAYSPAMKKWGNIWKQPVLDSYITAPMKLVPGSRMPYAGLKDATKRADLVAYLATLK